MSERTLCDALQEMREKVNILKDLINLTKLYDDFESREFDFWSEVDDIGDIVEEVQDYADRMELRLHNYKDAIESLGFERKRKR